MACPLHLEIPLTISILRSKSKRPFDVGQGCGELAQIIPIVVTRHLDKTHFDKPKLFPCDSTHEWSLPMDEFLHLITVYLQHARAADNAKAPFPDDLHVDRKARRPRKVCRTKYTKIIEDALKEKLKADLIDIFLRWDAESTRQFNKGFDWGHNRQAWVEYPPVNVALEAGSEDWSEWLKTRCEPLGRARVKRGLRSIEDW
ncbi:hypothetical protein EJ04DRAFT_497465 [Polyplosphaeria fusca]|uniref:Uncharacterized protein n=1 Tax=Polyplosphaeria fusca TaxID=682080 RepID=A0A9P4V196_9PLEO|nr:hypothetical protein EJ04DRAFT_497465 [Polyplosphaeria fusca]